MVVAAGCNFNHHNTTPELLEITPANSSVNIATDSNITLRFSESMDRETCESHFGLYPGLWETLPGSGAETVPGGFTWNSDGTEMTFHPGTMLGDSSTYSIVLLEGMQEEHHHDGMMMDHDHDGGMMVSDMEGFGMNAGSGLIIIFSTL